MVITKRTILIIMVVVVIGTFFWLINNHLGHVTVAAAADSPQVASNSKKPNAPENDLNKLLLERKQILQKIVDTMEMQYKQGVADTVQLRQSKIDLLLADLDLAKTITERIDIHHQIVQLYKDAEDDIATRVATGRAPSLDLEKAKVARLTAQIELAKEQLAAKSAK
jgi:outer membrane protein TolC